MNLSPVNFITRCHDTKEDRGQFCGYYLGQERIRGHKGTMKHYIFLFLFDNFSKSDLIKVPYHRPEVGINFERILTSQFDWKHLGTKDRLARTIVVVMLLGLCVNASL